MNNHKLPLLASALIFSGLCVAQPDIDLIYGTFLGASGDEFALHNGIDISSDGRFGFVGITDSPFMSTTPDAYQSQLQALFTRFVVICNNEGEPIYRSYFGDLGSRGCFAFTEVDGFVVGGGTSVASYPTTPGAHQTEFVQSPGGGSSMATLSKFDSDYQLEWSTFLGGTGSDGIGDVQVDAQGFIYVTGLTSSPDMATAGAYQASITNEATQCSYLARFTSEGALDYFTYFQGNDLTRISHCALSPDGSKVYVGGFTRSTEGIASDGFPDQNGGDSDGFLACFESGTGELVWSQFIGGEERESFTSFVVSDNGQLVVHFQTYSTTGIATPGAHLEEAPVVFELGNEPYNRVLMVLNEDGSTEWATYFDETHFWMVTSVIGGLAVHNGEILVSGFTVSEEGVVAGAPFEDELQPDFGQMIAKFDLETGAQIWGTYFGLEGKVNIYNMAYIDDGRFMTVGTGRNPNGYITDDAYQSVFGGGANDFYYAIFEENTLSTREVGYQPLQLYPNPTGDAVRVTAPGNLYGTVVLQVYDLSGRMVLQKAAFHSGTELRVGHLPAGIYVVHVQDGEAQYRQKLVVAH